MAKLGTLSVGAGNVTLSRGRGKNKAVVLDVSFKELEIWAAKNGVDEKKLWEKSYGRACHGLKQKFRKVVSNGGGCEGVPKFKDFEAFTKELREKTHKTAPMGGILSDKSLVVAYKIGNTQYIGWPDTLKKGAENFQEGAGGWSADLFLQSDKSRHWLHSLGIKDVPHEYVHNPRRVLPEPFGSYVDKYLDEWAEHSFYKELARQMAIKRHL